jgi:hypothetical protein
MIHQRRSEIHKAFKALEHAIEAKEAELKQNFKKPEYSNVMNNMVSNSMETVGASLGQYQDLLIGGQALFGVVKLKAQKELTRDPWGFVGKVALCSFGLGLIFGSRYRNSRSRVKK